VGRGTFGGYMIRGPLLVVFGRRGPGAAVAAGTCAGRGTDERSGAGSSDGSRLGEGSRMG
jgi:hypothetical protein